MTTQSIVPCFAFSSTSHGAVGMVTPLGKLTSTTRPSLHGGPADATRRVEGRLGEPSACPHAANAAPATTPAAPRDALTKNRRLSIVGRCSEPGLIPTTSWVLDPRGNDRPSLVEQLDQVGWSEPAPSGSSRNRRRGPGWTAPVASPLVSWVGPLRKPLRRLAFEAVQRGQAWVAQVGAIGPNDARGRSFGAFLAGELFVFPQGSIYNEQYIHIGEGTIVGPDTSLSAGMAPGQVMASNPVVRIGDHCVIGRGSHVVGHWSIEVGDEVQTGPYVYITDQNHSSYADVRTPIGRQWPVEAAVRIGSGSSSWSPRSGAAGRRYR